MELMFEKWSENPIADFQISKYELTVGHRYGIIATLCQKVLEVERSAGSKISIVLDDKTTTDETLSFNVYGSVAPKKDIFNILNMDLQGMTVPEVCKTYPEQAASTLQSLSKRNEALETALKDILEEANHTSDAGEYILWVLNRYSKLL